LLVRVCIERIVSRLLGDWTASEVRGTLVVLGDGRCSVPLGRVVDPVLQRDHIYNFCRPRIAYWPLEGINGVPRNDGYAFETLGLRSVTTAHPREELRRLFYCVLGRRHGATRPERLFQPIGFNPRTDPPLGPLSIGSCSNTVEKKRKKRKLDNGWRARRVLFDLSVTEWRRKVEGKAKDVLVERDDMPSLLLLA
jgi:hypothetical protein